MVVIDKRGHEWRFDTLKAAHELTGDSEPIISGFINDMKKRTVYSKRGFAYRRAEDWDRMTEDQRRNYLNNQGGMTNESDRRQ